MKKRPARLAVLLVVTFGLLGVAEPPARAEGVTTLTTFVGSLELSNGLKNPGTSATPCVTGGNPDPGCVAVTPGPSGEPRVTVDPDGNSVAFVFNTLACVSTRVGGPNGTELGVPELCVITMTGVLRGFNGLATGWGSFSYMELATGSSFNVNVEVTLEGDVLSLAGGDKETPFFATILVGPNPEPEPEKEDPPPPPPRQSGGLSTRSD